MADQDGSRVNFNAPLRPADHALANALTALVLMRIPNAAEAAMLREVIRDAAARCNRAHPQLVPLLEAARAMMNTIENSGERSRARMAAEAALQRFAMWRLGLALERAREKEPS